MDNFIPSSLVGEGEILNWKQYVFKSIFLTKSFENVHGGGTFLCILL